jgi:hypothetical protein
MANYITWAYDDDNTEHQVNVEYSFTKPRRATQWEPAEGGVEIESVTCKTRELTKQEIDSAEQECIDDVWALYYGREA